MQPSGDYRRPEDWKASGLMRCTSVEWVTKALNWGPAPQIMPTLGGAASAPCKDGIKISLADPVLPQMSYLVRANMSFGILWVEF